MCMIGAPIIGAPAICSRFIVRNALYDTAPARVFAARDVPVASAPFTIRN